MADKLFKDRLGTGTFSLGGYTAKLQSTLMNMTKFEAVTGYNNLLKYLLEKGESQTAASHVVWFMMVDFYQDGEPSTSLLDRMDLESTHAWLHSDAVALHGQPQKMEELKECLFTIMGFKYQDILAAMPDTKKKDADKAPSA